VSAEVRGSDDGHGCSRALQSAHFVCSFGEGGGASWDKPRAGQYMARGLRGRRGLVTDQPEAGKSGAFEARSGEGAAHGSLDWM